MEANADLATGREVAPNLGAAGLGGGVTGVVDVGCLLNSAVGVVGVPAFLKKGEDSETPPNAPNPEAGLTGVDKLLNTFPGGG